MGVFNKTIIPLTLVEYEMIIANSTLRASLAIYRLISNAPSDFLPVTSFYFFSSLSVPMLFDNDMVSEKKKKQPTILSINKHSINLNPLTTVINFYNSEFVQL